MAVTGTFQTTAQVREAIDSLIAAGFAPDSISAITPTGKPIDELTPVASDELNDLAKGAGLGALIGGAAGLALTTLIFPPLGLLLVGGQLALGGALAGGVIGALVEAGHSHDEASRLADELEAGRYLVVVHTADGALQAETALRNAGAHTVTRSDAP